ncbi:cell wall-binding protein [Clostridium carboxidivorans P7]|uniref:Putative cell wall binding repeat 2-containing protein n=1 Tax=Clostridium carboxidivorans P7 TaxID=536227 RepID=C6Q103_9CLOT|nr:cell wall-binding repeat-containing protein [Clostridium carboxidivorans]AKN33766.1 cell wall-binding protein [Clostridium carboxidivorans P7]EET84822.1 putative cell wall binding repeat 2-containing protein [Clostridium carboxidivorans P7]EFG86628.1 hypothetical protein CLCAR_3578 [Clostridium carboxidivorans P7]
MQKKKLIILTAMAVLLEAGSINVYAKENNYTSSRLGGQTRIETAVKIASDYNSGQLNAVVVSTANDFPEALTGSALASKCKAPILLVNQTSRDSQSALDYIKSHLSSNGTVYVLGTTSSVSSNVENAIRGMGFSNIKRLAGANKDETFKAINNEIGVAAGTPVFIASSDNFPDALSASGIAAIKGYPIILCSQGALPQAAIDQLQAIKPSQIFVAGGPAVVPEGVVQKAIAAAGVSSDKVVRLYGQDRYDTSLAIAKYFNLFTPNAVIASGENFPDALAGSSLAAKNNAPIVLVGGDNARQKEYLDATEASKLTVLGGTGVMPEGKIDALKAKYHKTRIEASNQIDMAVKLSDEFVKNGNIGSYRVGDKDNTVGAYHIKPIDVTNSFTADATVKNAIIIAENDKASAIGCLSLSVYLNAPVLITEQGSLNSQTATQLAKLNIKNVYLAGGTGMISSSVESQLKASGYSVTRYSGNDAIETNRMMLKAIPKELFGPKPMVVNEDDWAQGATVASCVKFHNPRTFGGDDKTYINPVFILKANTSTVEEFKDVSAVLKPLESSWNSKQKDFYQVFFDESPELRYKSTIDTVGSNTTQAEVDAINHKLIQFTNNFGLSTFSIPSTVKKGASGTNIEINYALKGQLAYNGESYKVRTALFCGKDSTTNNLALPALAAKYGIGVYFSGGSIPKSYKDHLLSINKTINGVYYIGGTSEVPDGSESILNGR